MFAHERCVGSLCLWASSLDTYIYVVWPHMHLCIDTDTGLSILINKIRLVDNPNGSSVSRLGLSLCENRRQTYFHIEAFLFNLTLKYAHVQVIVNYSRINNRMVKPSLSPWMEGLGFTFFISFVQNNYHIIKTPEYQMFCFYWYYRNGPKERQVPKERLARKSGRGVTYHINNKRRVSNERLARISAYIRLSANVCSKWHHYPLSRGHATWMIYCQGNQTTIKTSYSIT